MQPTTRTLTMGQSALPRRVINTDRSALLDPAYLTAVVWARAASAAWPVMEVIWYSQDSVPSAMVRLPRSRCRQHLPRLNSPTLQIHLIRSLPLRESPTSLCTSSCLLPPLPRPRPRQHTMLMTSLQQIQSGSRIHRDNTHSKASTQLRRSRHSCRPPGQTTGCPSRDDTIRPHPAAAAVPNKAATILTPRRRASTANSHCRGPTSSSSRPPRWVP